MIRRIPSSSALFVGLCLSDCWSRGCGYWPVLACIWKGAKTVGKVVWVTVLGPWALLILFVIRGVTLEGATDGLYYYLSPQWSMLWNFNPGPGEIGAHELWLAAISQVFFSLTVGFGVMIAYGSFMDNKTNIVKSAWIIGIGDALTAIVGGFAVFGALGHKAHAAGVPISEVVESGPGLTFVTYPEIINGLPFPILFGILFFLMLSLLAVDSAFSLVEAMAAALRDKFGFTHRRANVGWYYPASRLREFVNGRSDVKLGIWWDIRIRYIVPAAILFMLGFEIYDRYREAYGEFNVRSQELVFGWGVLILVFVGSLILANLRSSKSFQATGSDD